jgi:hypothetical protein
MHSISSRASRSWRMPLRLIASQACVYVRTVDAGENRCVFGMGAGSPASSCTAETATLTCSPLRPSIRGHQRHPGLQHRKGSCAATPFPPSAAAKSWGPTECQNNVKLRESRIVIQVDRGTMKCLWSSSRAVRRGSDDVLQDYSPGGDGEWVSSLAVTQGCGRHAKTWNGMARWQR